MLYRIEKRILDLTLSLLALVVLSPVLLIVAILIRVKMGSPVIFKQERPGLNEKPFYLYKFRTMTNAKDKNGELLPKEKRVTPLGKFLRATSLDELPELLNVVVGNMSLVGPRPLAMAYLARYNSEQRRRHTVLPGLTGLAQINGRNSLSWEKTFEYDVLYVEKRSFWFDCKIILLTIVRVLKREGADAAAENRTDFLGTPNKS